MLRCTTVRSINKTRGLCYTGPGYCSYNSPSVGGCWGAHAAASAAAAIVREVAPGTTDSLVRVVLSRPPHTRSRRCCWWEGEHRGASIFLTPNRSGPHFDQGDPLRRRVNPLIQSRARCQPQTPLNISNESKSQCMQCGGAIPYQVPGNILVHESVCSKLEKGQLQRPQAPTKGECG